MRQHIVQHPAVEATDVRHHRILGTEAVESFLRRAEAKLVVDGLDAVTRGDFLSVRQHGDGDSTFQRGCCRSSRGRRRGGRMASLKSGEAGPGFHDLNRQRGVTRFVQLSDDLATLRWAWSGGYLLIARITRIERLELPEAASTRPGGAAAHDTETGGTGGGGSVLALAASKPFNVRPGRITASTARAKPRRAR